MCTSAMRIIAVHRSAYHYKPPTSYFLLPTSYLSFTNPYFQICEHRLFESDSNGILQGAALEEINNLITNTMLTNAGGMIK